MRIYHNLKHYWEIPPFCKQNPKILNSIGDNLTDNAKFYWLQLIGDEFYFVCDDDIIYPPGYVEKTLIYLNTYPIAGYHGRQIQTTGDWLRSYYYGGHLTYSYLNTVRELTPVDIIGTGVAAFRADVFNPTGITYSKHKRMSDLVFSKIAAEMNVPMYVIPHETKWLQPIRTDGSIYSDSYRADQSEQVGLVLDIAKLRGIV